MIRAILFVIGVLAAHMPAQVTLHHPSGMQLVDGDVKIEKLGGGMQFVEGPVWFADRKELVFSDIPRGKLLRWSEKGGVVEWLDTKQSNGNTIDSAGRLISCQHAGRDVVRYDDRGRVTVIASRYDGKLLNSPNDVAVRYDGSIWFTDPTYGLRGRKKEQAGNFVYRIDPRTGDITIVQRDFDMPNGICFSPSGDTLYIADSGSKQRIGAFDVLADKTLGEPKVWFKGGADGVRCDELGNLYTAARDGVRIYSPKGGHLVTIALPEVPANIAFGGDGRRDLFVTARTSLYRVPLRVAGPASVGEGWMTPSPQMGAHNDRSGLYSSRWSPLSAQVAGGVAAGLAWLKDHQDEDGKWDCDQFMKHDTEGEACDGAGSPAHDVGITGLALLAFLGDGNTLRVGPYKKVVKKAVVWLRSQQQESGLFGTRAAHDYCYDHAIATYAICEAYGLSEYKLLRPVAQGGVDYLESHRNADHVWRYQPRGGDNDTSITSWALMAYKTADHFGLKVNKKALAAGARWLDEVSDPSGRHGYTKKGERSSRHPGDHATRFPVTEAEAMTAVGLFCRFFLGQDPRDKPVMMAAADLIRAKPPAWRWKQGSIDHYYWYWASHAMFQMGGEYWAEWERHLAAAVLRNQNDALQSKSLAGSWDPVGVWGVDGGRVYSTAMLTLALESGYRYTRYVVR